VGVAAEAEWKMCRRARAADALKMDDSIVSDESRGIVD